MSFIAKILNQYLTATGLPFTISEEPPIERRGGKGLKVIFADDEVQYYFPHNLEWWEYREPIFGGALEPSWGTTVLCRDWPLMLGLHVLSMKLGDWRRVLYPDDTVEARAMRATFEEDELTVIDGWLQAGIRLLEETIRGRMKLNTRAVVPLARHYLAFHSARTSGEQFDRNARSYTSPHGDSQLPVRTGNDFSPAVRDNDRTVAKKYQYCRAVRKRDYQLAYGNTADNLRESGLPFELTVVKVGGPIQSWTVKVIFGGSNSRYYFSRRNQWLVYGDGVGDSHQLGVLENAFTGDLAASILEGYIDLLRALFQPLGPLEKMMVPANLDKQEMAEVRVFLLQAMKQLDVIANNANPAVAQFALGLYERQLAMMQQAEDEMNAETQESG